MLPLYATTMLLSAALLFVVQPMVAKMLLPALGGSSAVWTTCMLFFQGLLLAGYGYAHAGARWLAPRNQAALHVALMLVAGAILPIAIVPEVEAHAAPITWLLMALVAGVGLPFLVVSASAPMFQHWFSKTGHDTADDPYHLYAASNIGSMVALLGYPLVVEPAAGIADQSRFWSIGYGILVVATIACAIAMLRNAPAEPPTGAARAVSPDAASWRQIFAWVGLAFVPSSLMLGVTQYLTTDIASVPLFWVVPLALYLATFILVFARRAVRVPRWGVAVLPWATLGVVAASMYHIPMWIVIGAHLLVFFVIAAYFHGALADRRPHAGDLTRFYVWMSVGGALGGLFNALIAPVLFDRLIEYFLVLAAAVAVLPSASALYPPENDLHPSKARFALPPIAFLATGVFLNALGFIRWNTGWRVGVAMVLSLAAAALIAWRPRRVNVVLAVIFAVGIGEFLFTSGLVAQQRSFFAAYRVADRTYSGHRIRKFSHGTTSHGAQSLEPELRDEPIAYHHPSGPVGQVLDVIPHAKVGVVGLGIGAMAPYARPGTHFDFYEIDPLVEEMARDHFTYLSDCADRCSVFIGDGRLLLADVPDETYDILFLDAYNSDSVPTHLLTREAIQLYVSKLTPRGILVFNVSNRFMDVQSVVGALAKDAGFVALNQTHYPPKALRKRYVMIASYSVVARQPAHLGPLVEDERWSESRADSRVWTDDYTNILEVFDWD